MKRKSYFPFLIATHILFAVMGFAAGVYMLPILIAPPAPTAIEVTESAQNAVFSGEFSQDRADSDGLHWGEGNVSIGTDFISLMGQLSPGPDYRLYLAKEFVETEADFNRLKNTMAQVAPIKTFENFVVSVPESIHPAEYNTVIIWCEAFGEFITSAQYQ